MGTNRRTYQRYSNLKATPLKGNCRQHWNGKSPQNCVTEIPKWETTSRQAKNSCAKINKIQRQGTHHKTSKRCEITRPFCEWGLFATCTGQTKRTFTRDEKGKGSRKNCVSVIRQVSCQGRRSKTEIMSLVDIIKISVFQYFRHLCIFVRQWVIC